MTRRRNLRTGNASNILITGTTCPADPNKEPAGLYAGTIAAGCRECLAHRIPSSMPKAEISAPATNIPYSGAFSLSKARLFETLKVSYSASMYIRPKSRADAHLPLPQ